MVIRGLVDYMVRGETVGAKPRAGGTNLPIKADVNTGVDSPALGPEGHFSGMFKSKAGSIRR
jgi:hypothetical protein